MQEEINILSRQSTALKKFFASYYCNNALHPEYSNDWNNQTADNQIILSINGKLPVQKYFKWGVTNDQKYMENSQHA
jgi:uncharacterized CHY-type Zn-finger protein